MPAATPDPTHGNRRVCTTGKPVADCGFDPFERQSLVLMRHIFTAMARSRHARSEDLVPFTQGLFGTASGDRIFVALLCFVRTMSLSRSETFRYSNPLCPGCAIRITPEEEHLMRILHHVRAGREGRAMIHALMICDREPIGPLIEAAHAVIREGRAIAG